MAKKSLGGDFASVRAGARNKTQKSQKQGIKIPVATWKKINDELLNKYGIKSFQALYDYLIVSGLVYLKRDIVALVRERIPEYTERYKRISLAKLGKGDPVELPEMHTATMYMYLQDYTAFNKFVIEEKGAKKFWVIEILMEEFAKENSVILDLIRDCQKHKVTERKQQVSRLLDDEYIQILPEAEANEILDRMTERYDKREFGSELVQAEIKKIISAAAEKQYQEVELEEDFNAKLASIRRSRTAKAARITDTVIDDDTIP